MRLSYALLVFGLTAGLVEARPRGSTVARGSSKATQLAKEAERLYSAGHYLDAAEQLKQAWAIEPKPVYLFNLARAYDQAGELEQAMSAYKQLTEAEGVDAQLFTRANLAIDRLKALMGKQEADRLTQELERKRLEKESVEARSRADAESAVAQKKIRELQEAQRQDEERRLRQERQARGRSSGRRVAAWVLGGLAVAGLGVGVGLGVSANGSRGAFVTATTLEQKKRLDGQAHTEALAADIAFGAAAVAAVGAILVLPRGGGDAAVASFGVQPLPGGLAAALEVPLP